jgi:hypothetical protein
VEPHDERRRSLGVTLVMTGMPAPVTERRVSRRSGVERAICWGLGIGIGVQVAQRFLYSGHVLSEYGRSLWFVDYQHGFVRRGLAGALLRLAVGGSPSLTTVDLVQNALAVAMFAAVVALVVVLCRQRTVIGYATAAVLVASPFGFDSLGGQRRPDLVGFVLLTLVCIAAARRRSRAVALACVGGAALGVSALVSEVSPLIIGPWLLLVVAASARAHAESATRTRMAMLLAAGPSVLALFTLGLWGRPSSQTVAAIEHAAPRGIRGHGSIFEYLPDTFGGSVSRVVHGPARIAWSLVFGALLCVLLLMCIRAALPYVRATFCWILPTRRLRVAWTIGTLAAAAVLFALGLDTLRWISSVGFVALLTAGGVVALTGESVVGPAGRDRWRRPLSPRSIITGGVALSLIVGTYLLLLPPLPNWIRGADGAARLLLEVPK